MQLDDIWYLCSWLEVVREEGASSFQLPARAGEMYGEAGGAAAG